jgi:hypothetical protein
MPLRWRIRLCRRSRGVGGLSLRIRLDTIKNIVSNPSRRRSKTAYDLSLRFRRIRDFQDETRSVERRNRCAVVENKGPIRGRNRSMKQIHRSLPASDNSIGRNIVPALRDAERNTFHVRLRVLGADKEQLDKIAGFPGTHQDIHLARVRHHGFKREASFCLDARFAAMIRDCLRLGDASPIRAGRRFRDFVRIDVFAELDTLPTQPYGQRRLTRAVRPGNHQQKGLRQKQSPGRKSSSRVPRFRCLLSCALTAGRRSHRSQILDTAVRMITEAPTATRAGHRQPFRPRFLGGGAPRFPGKPVKLFRG